MRAYKLAKCQPVRVDAALIKRRMYQYSDAEIEQRIASIDDADLREKARRIYRLAYVG